MYPDIYPNIFQSKIQQQNYFAALQDKTFLANSRQNNNKNSEDCECSYYHSYFID